MDFPFKKQKKSFAEYFGCLPCHKNRCSTVIVTPSSAQVWYFVFSYFKCSLCKVPRMKRFVPNRILPLATYRVAH